MHETQHHSTFFSRLQAGRLALLPLMALVLVGGCRLDSGTRPDWLAGVDTPTVNNPPNPGPGGNRAPTLAGALPPQVLVGQPISLTLKAADADGDPLTYSAKGLPDWLAIDARTGAVSGKPAAGDVGTYRGIYISVNDGKTSTSLPEQKVAVVATASGKATLSWLPPTENVDGSPLTDLAGYRIRYGTSPDALGQSVQIPSPGVATYVIDELTPATWYFVVSAYTASGAESEPSEVVSKKISG